MVERGGQLRQHGGMAEGDRADERAKTNARRLPRERTEEDPGVGGHQFRSPRRRIVVLRQQRRVEARRLARLGHRERIGVAHPFLDLDRQAELHATLSLAHRRVRSLRTVRGVYGSGAPWGMSRDS